MKMPHLKFIVIILVALIWNFIWNIFKPAWMPQLKLLKNYCHNTGTKAVNTYISLYQKIYWIIRKYLKYPQCFAKNAL